MTSRTTHARNATICKPEKSYNIIMIRWVTARPRLTRATFSPSAPATAVVAAAAPAATTTSGAATTSTTTNTASSSSALHRHHAAVIGLGAHTNPVSACSAVIADATRCNSTSSGAGGGGGGGGSFSSGMRGAELRDEEELVHVLGTQPKHVARRVRQMMATSRRRLSHFRNTVTYLMIVLQGKLQKGDISAADAAVVVEGILQECVELGQSDMAHLLFRAALRFRKYGVSVSPKCVHALYGSFRVAHMGSSSSSPSSPSTGGGGGGAGDGNSSDDARRGLLGQLAVEMKEQPDLKGLTIAAFIYAGQIPDAQALQATMTSAELSDVDYCTIIQAYANTRHFKEVGELVGDAGRVDREGFDNAAVYSAAIASCAEDRALQDALLAECVQNACAPSDAAVAAVMRSRLVGATTLEHAIQVEADLRQQLKRDQLGLPATTAFVMRCSDFYATSFKAGDSTMEAKIEQLAQIVEMCIDNGESDQIDHSYAIALVRGFGALGHFDRMMAMVRKMREHTAVVDFKVYDECMRWLANAGNVKLMLEIKDFMEKEHVYHSSSTYVFLLRGLDRFYPRLTYKFIDEARKMLPFFDERMYTQMLNSYGLLRDMDSARNVYAEMVDRDSRGRRCFNVFSVAQLLRNMAGDPALFDEIVALGTRRNLLGHESVQRAIIWGYAAQRRSKDLHALVAQLPRKSFMTYLALVRAYGKLDDTAGFDRLLDEMTAAQVPFNDAFFAVAAEICARWRDSGRFKRMVEITRGATEASRSGSSQHALAKDPRALARIASAHAMMNDWDTVAALWKEVRNSQSSIPMGVFNRFLELCVKRNDLVFAQDVLELMMARVPPNQVTTTTVMDMLARMGRLHEVEVLLDEMCRTKNIQPTLVTFHHAMSAFAKVGDVARLVALRDRLRASGLKENVFTHNIMLSGYGRAQRFESIPELLAARSAQNIPIDTNGYEILLDIYAKARLHSELENTVQAILRRPADVNSNRHGGADASARSGVRGDENSSLVGAAFDNTLPPRLLCAIATAYSHLGDVANVEKYVTTLLAHRRCAQSHIETCFLIYHRLRDNAKLDSLLVKYGGSEFVLNVCISAFAKAGMYERVATILDELQTKRMALHANTAVVLSSLLLKAGKVELAQTVLRFRRVAEAQYLLRQDDNQHGGGAAGDDDGGDDSNSVGGSAMEGGFRKGGRSRAQQRQPLVDVVTPAAIAEAEVFTQH